MLLTLETQLEMFPEDLQVHPAVMLVARHVERAVWSKVQSRHDGMSPAQWTSAELVCRQNWAVYPPVALADRMTHPLRQKSVSARRRLPRALRFDGHALAQAYVLYDETGQWRYCEGYVGTGGDVVKAAWAHLGGLVLGTVQAPGYPAYQVRGRYPADWRFVGAEIPTEILRAVIPFPDGTRVLDRYDTYYGDVTMNPEYTV